MKKANVFLLGVAIFLTSTSHARQSGSAQIYMSQYTQLRERATALIAKSPDGPTDRARLQDQQLALLKLTHRLQEEATRDYYEQSRRPGGEDKSLLFIGNACSALGYTLESFDNFLTNGDRSFLLLARRGIELMDTVQQFF